MQLISFKTEKSPRAGVRFSDVVFDTGKIMADLLVRWPESFRELPSSVGMVSDRRRLVPERGLTLVAPIPIPPKIIGIGMNYVDHCLEQGLEPPESPVIFAKFSTAVIGPEESVSWPVGLTNQVDWEVELAVVIGRKARHVTAEAAPLYIAGYTIGNDVSARDLQVVDGQFVRGKSIDTFCPLGPALVTPDEVGDPMRLELGLELNGQVMQRSKTMNLIFDVYQLVAFCSRSFTLLPGDVILTGTPPGVGGFRKPPIYLKPGDRMVAWIERLGQLVTPVSGPQPA